MATTSRVRVRRAAPIRPGLPARRRRQRPGAPRPFVITSTPRRHPWRSLRPGRCCRVWIALLGAAFSTLIIGVMAGAAIVCADHACLADPAPGRAVLELHPGPPAPTAPVTLGRLPTADPAR